MAAITCLGSVRAAEAGYTLVGWNNLGMHCMDADFSVLSLLPPYNTIHAQLASRPSSRGDRRTARLPFACRPEPRRRAST